MNTFYIDFWLKNKLIMETYVDTTLDGQTILDKLTSTKSPYIEANLRGNGNLIAIKKEEIVCIEMKGKGESI